MTASPLSLKIVDQSSSVAVVKTTKQQLSCALMLSRGITVPTFMLTPAMKTFIQIKGLLSGVQFGSES